MGSAPDRSYLAIREVLDLLLVEFPDITISKIRFLEGKGLIHPERTPSGYRKFYEADVERLRWILRQQREHFLPLKVIKGRLEQYNGSLSTEAPSLFDADATLLVPVPPAANGRGTPSKDARSEDEAETDAVTSEAVEDDPSREDEEVQEAPATQRTRKSRASAASTETAAVDESDSSISLTREDLLLGANADEALVCELEEYGLIAPRVVAGVECYDEVALATCALAARFRTFGIEARHLKVLKHAAERETALFTQVVAPLLLQRNPTARARAEENLVELTELGAALRDVFVQGELLGFKGG